MKGDKMRIICERAKVTTACMGNEAYDAELEIEELSGGQLVTLYIHANLYDGMHYSVSRQSMFDYMTGLSDVDPGEIDFIEEYEDLDEIQNSKYKVYFEIADRLIKDLTSF